MNEILVTGATGNVGRHIVTLLSAQGYSVVGAARGADAVRTIFGRRVRAASLDFYDVSTWGPAVAGCKSMFLMRPPAIADVQKSINPFVDFARGEGVEHVVFLSVAGAEKNNFVPHRKVEDHLRSCGIAHSNLRPGFFAQNLETAYRQDIVENDRIYVPAGRSAPVNWIDTRDIAEVAALILTDPAPHFNKSYTLTGPGAVPWSHVTTALTKHLGRRIEYVPAFILAYVSHLKRRGLPWGAVAVQTILHVLLRFGQGATEDLTLEQLLGRRGRTIEAYVEEHASLWAQQP